MNQTSELKIQACEEELRKAMLNSDVKALDHLLASDLIFTNHLGRTMTKQDDLEAHRSGVLKINKINLSDQEIRIVENVAIVSVVACISGQFNDETTETIFRFTRVWYKTSADNWQVIAAHSTIVA